MKNRIQPEDESIHRNLEVDISIDGSVRIHFLGDWILGRKLPSFKETLELLTSDINIRRIGFETTGLNNWDSILVTLLLKLKKYCAENSIKLETGGLPEGARRLLMMATRIPEKKEVHEEQTKENAIYRLGENTIYFLASVNEVLEFIGEIFTSLFRLLQGKASLRLTDLGQFLQECGSQAFFIVSLINILVGLILAFIGAVQLKTFGAEIYVADLVGIAMVRVMGAVMTGVIMSGRTGAAFAAQLGTMQVNEEIDALRTLGVSPVEFLVFPRLLALTLMMPLLCLYADLMGILGGMIVGVVMLGINPIIYLNQTMGSLTLTNLWIGLFHSAVFGVLIAISGCLRGMQCGRSASAVGYATTSAVVTGIVSCIAATAIITMLCNALGI